MNNITGNFTAPPRLFFAAFIVGLWFTLPSISAAQPTEGETDSAIYFNAATEKYIQGDLDSAAANAEKAVASDPSNPKLSEFAGRIFYEAAQDSHNLRDYRKALAYLEKARTYSPSDGKISNLYEVTKNIMDRSVAQQIVPVKKSPPPASAAPSAAPSKPQISPPAPVYVVERAPVRADERLPVIYIAALLAAVAAFSLAANVVMWLFFGKKIKKSAQLLTASAESSEKLKTEFQAQALELEKTKEALKYEREAAGRLIADLKEEKNAKNKRYEEQLRMALDIRQKQMEELFKSSAVSESSKRTSVLHGHRAKVLERIGDATYIDEDSSVALEAARERISAQAKELYSASASGCMSFLREMVSNGNPLIRSNIARALSRLASPETLDMLIALWRDPSFKVRREALRELKNMRDALSRGALKLDEKSAVRLTETVKEAVSGGDWIF
jgi:tetratricopeptide (TPR) repeat protein